MQQLNADREYLLEKFTKFSQVALYFDNILNKE